MNERPVANPFVPGRGSIPPYLAGRDAEQRRLLDLGRQKSAYYEDRREELERHDLLAVAAGMAAVFGERATLRSGELNAADGGNI